MQVDLSFCRREFPALDLRVNGHMAAYFDGPGGTQVPARVIKAITRYYQEANANCHGEFVTSRRTDGTIAAARQTVAEMLGAASPDEIAFGPNMTTLNFALSRALGRALTPGDEIVITDLDHEANRSPWQALEERGVVVRSVRVNLPECTLDYDDLERAVNARTRVVALGYASNAVGTINDVKRAASLAHSVGAVCVVDAVHYALHGAIDVRDIGCDFLLCSAYKFFGPHVGILYGRRDAFERLAAYRVRPQSSKPPHKIETGTLNHEGIAGVIAAIEFIASLGAALPRGATAGFPPMDKGKSGEYTTAAAGGSQPPSAPHLDGSASSGWGRAGQLQAGGLGTPADAATSKAARDKAGDAEMAEIPARRPHILAGFTAIELYERPLFAMLMDGLASIPGVTVYGLPAAVGERTPTVSFSVAGKHPADVARFLGDRGIFVWHGDFYATTLIERLGRAESGGVVRVGIAPYNTTEEVSRLVEALKECAGLFS
ncbi:MAG: aminotransferase class V-fold PLP-dependent enzyme [Bacillota bacterium]|nr:aminotransferase class V-fold PLP-dependent enzyme [Bacillota bacterium]